MVSCRTLHLIEDACVCSVFNVCYVSRTLHTVKGCAAVRVLTYLHPCCSQTSNTAKPPSLPKVLLRAGDNHWAEAPCHAPPLRHAHQPCRSVPADGGFTGVLCGQACPRRNGLRVKDEALRFRIGCVAHPLQATPAGDAGEQGQSVDGQHVGA